jgi:hypothetical protein
VLPLLVATLACSGPYPEGPLVSLDGSPLTDGPAWDRTRGVLSVTVPFSGGTHEIRVHAAPPVEGN